MFTVSFIGSFCRLQHNASRRHGASFCVSSESRNYLTKSFKAITDLTVLIYDFIQPFSRTIQTLPRTTLCPGLRGFTAELGLSLLFSQCVYQATRAWQLVCFITASTAASSGRWLCVLPACSLIHTYVKVHIRSLSLFLTLCLSCHLCCSLAGGLLFFLQRWVSVDLCWELCHSLGARCHPKNLHALIPAHFVQWSCSLTFELNFTYIQKGVN